MRVEVKLGDAAKLLTEAVLVQVPLLQSLLAVEKESLVVEDDLPPDHAWDLAL